MIEQLERQVRVRREEGDSAGRVSPQEKVIKEVKGANKLQALCPEITLKTLREVVVLSPTYRDVIETILPQLDYIVVDTFGQARAISEYLKQKKIGRMTFLIKELIRQSKKDSLALSAPPQTKLAVDLISCSDSDSRDIVVWALGSTLVTN